jgi:hypothetical protein
VRGQEAVLQPSRVPPWWSMIVSAWGMAMVTFSAKLDLNPGLYPIIGVAIMAAPAAGAERFLRRRSDNGDGDE